MCLWFRAGKRADETENVFARVEAGKMMITFDRGDYWQCAYVIAKGQYDAVKARGLQALLDDVVADGADPQIGRRRREELGRRQASDGGDQSPEALDAAGIAVIGDAAHAMSPIGGVGVNLAVQDAVATANLLAAKLVSGCPSEAELDAVRQRREFPVKMTQRMQTVVQNKIINDRAEAGQPAAESAADRAAGHCGALAARHHRALCRDWCTARARAVGGASVNRWTGIYQG